MEIPKTSELSSYDLVIFNFFFFSFATFVGIIEVKCTAVLIESKKSRDHGLKINNYCAFHKHANSEVQKSLSQLRFSLPSIIITITSNEP